MRKVVKELPRDVVSIDEFDGSKVYILEEDFDYYILKENHISKTSVYLTDKDRGFSWYELDNVAFIWDDAETAQEALQLGIEDGEVYEFDSFNEFALWYVNQQ